MIYLDTSAILSLIFKDTNSAALLEYLEKKSVASSLLAHVEIHRALRRIDLPFGHANELSERITYLNFKSTVARLAEAFPDKHLATLDAIHIATAISNDFSTFVTYDKRQASAAIAAGLTVIAPGVD